MRLSEIASMNFGLTPSLAATALPISMSKPSTSPDCGFLTPNGGTSNFTPIVISPFAWILPRVEVRVELLSCSLGRGRSRLPSTRPAARRLLFVATAGKCQRAHCERYTQPTQTLHVLRPSP